MAWANTLYKLVRGVPKGHERQGQYGETRFRSGQRSLMTKNKLWASIDKRENLTAAR
jgi:hypothetical protein